MLVQRGKTRENNHTEENVLGCAGGAVTTTESPVQGAATRGPREFSSFLRRSLSRSHQGPSSHPRALRHLPAPEPAQGKEQPTRTRRTQLLSFPQFRTSASVTVCFSRRRSNVHVVLHPSSGCSSSYCEKCRSLFLDPGKPAGCLTPIQNEFDPKQVFWKDPMETC